MAFCGEGVRWCSLEGREGAQCVREGVQFERNGVHCVGMSQCGREGGQWGSESVQWGGAGSKVCDRGSAV